MLIIQFKFFQFSDFRCAAHTQNNLNSVRYVCFVSLLLLSLHIFFFSFIFPSKTLAKEIDFNVFACAKFFVIGGHRQQMPGIPMLGAKLLSVCVCLWCIEWAELVCACVRSVAPIEKNFQINEPTEASKFKRQN